MLKNLALKYRLIFGGIAAVLIPFCIAGMIIYVQLSHSLLAMTEETVLHSAKDISDLLEATLMQEIKLASSIAADPAIVQAAETGDYRDAQATLEAVHSRVGSSLFTIFLADRNGIARADAQFMPEVGLDLSNRGYFLQAREGKTVLDGPLRSRAPSTRGDIIFMVCTPIQDESGFLGAIGIPFNSDLLADKLSQKTFGQTGIVFLTDSEGLVLFHPEKENILNTRFLDRPGMEDVGELVRNRKAGTAWYREDGTEMVAGLSYVNLTGWVVVLAQSKDEIMSPVNEVLSSIFIYGMVFLAIAIVMIVLFSSKIGTPIQKMVDMLKQVTQHSTEIILQIGPDRRILFANAAYEKATGLKAETLVGAELPLDNPGNIPSDVIWSSLNAGRPWSGRVLMNKNDRETIALDVMLIPLSGRGGAIQGYLEIGRDVTQELMFEKRLQQRQKLEAIGTLAGGIAHDFNNILGGILGYAELSLMDLDPGQSGSQEEYLREIMGAAERARGLVNQILAFSRKTDVELKPLSPKPILKEALNLLRASIPATIQIESRIVSDSTILAEPTQIHQVVMNLFTNAVHAIGEQPGTIQLELDDFPVNEEFARTHPAIKQGKHVLLRISDTGCGIAPEILDHIFDPFFTTKPHGKGTGLGLSVVHGIVTRLGGIITAYSELGKGSAFSIFVPCVDSAESSQDRIETPIRKGAERIALIDDEKAIAKSLQSILANHGYKVKAFTDGMEALLAIKASPRDFDLIITDYAMPRLTGLSLAGELRNAGVHIPVILMSGFLSEEIENAARNSGIAKILIKPISTHRLTDAIDCVVRAE